ncbi:DUF2291 family protein [Tessaracoccus palaemonis]|uniref:DUF2291 domain-containing protein n=1 Tax=Tessaracoccus palaemonis TaxID=2829499 RepID=A0ABX8SGX2_9ACTN|nr:DUF2291 family protein [Tessaracoccus palaemonis]QXT62616.1 DUF2291 domain-containing protein [Tessaracoccus palaemonis]
MAGRVARPLWRRGIVVWPVLIVVLLVLMFVNTTFVKAGSQAQAADTAVEYADLNYESVVVPTIQDAAQPLADIANGMVDDPEATGEEFGRREDADKPFSFSVTATGTLAEGSFGEVGLEVDGLPEGITAGIAIPPLGSSTAIRDAGTDLGFGSFTNQTEYQNVAIELNKRAAETVFADLDLTQMLGQQVTVTGALTWSSKTGGEVTHATIVPVQIETGS